MNTRKPLRYWLEIDGNSFPLREARGHEALSRPFRFEVELHSTAPVFAAPDELLRREASIHLELEGGTRVRTVAGILTEAALDAVIRGAPGVLLTLKPRFALSRHREDN